MPDINEVADQIAGAGSWDERVSLIRTIPQEFGEAHRQAVYERVAQRVYVEQLAPDFAYVHRRDDYELPSVGDSYQLAHAGTSGFTEVGPAQMCHVMEHHGTTLRVFRLIVGFTTQEFAAATRLPAVAYGLTPMTKNRVKMVEKGTGRALRFGEAAAAAQTVHDLMSASMFAKPPPDMARKVEVQTDTVAGWPRVADYAANGVPYATFLHLRHYGGSFRQLLDATSTARGNVLEDAVEVVAEQHKIPYVRTGAANQAAIERRFGIRVQPAPDFVFFDAQDVPRAMLEAKAANDGGTARDKAARFRTLRTEAQGWVGCRCSRFSQVSAGREPPMRSARLSPRVMGACSPSRTSTRWSPASRCRSSEARPRS